MTTEPAKPSLRLLRGDSTLQSYVHLIEQVTGEMLTEAEVEELRQALATKPMSSNSSTVPDRRKGAKSGL